MFFFAVSVVTTTKANTGKNNRKKCEICWHLPWWHCLSELTTATAPLVYHHSNMFAYVICECNLIQLGNKCIRAYVFEYPTFIYCVPLFRSNWKMNVTMFVYWKCVRHASLFRPLVFGFDHFFCASFLFPSLGFNVVMVVLLSGFMCVKLVPDAYCKCLC